MENLEKQRQPLESLLRKLHVNQTILGCHSPQNLFLQMRMISTLMWTKSLSSGCLLEKTFRAEMSSLTSSFPKICWEMLLLKLLHRSSLLVPLDQLVTLQGQLDKPQRQLHQDRCPTTIKMTSTTMKMNTMMMRMTIVTMTMRMKVSTMAGSQTPCLIEPSMTKQSSSNSLRVLSSGNSTQVRIICLRMTFKDI